MDVAIADVWKQWLYAILCDAKCMFVGSKRQHVFVVFFFDATHDMLGYRFNMSDYRALESNAKQL